MTWYFEQRILGTWMPATSADEPVAPKKSSGRRPIRAVQEVPEYFERLTLDHLREAMGPDGRFAAQHRVTP